MTVVADQSPGKVIRVGDGSNTTFDFSPIKIYDPGTGNDNELQVTITDSNGTVTELSEGTGATNYIVNLVTDYPSTGSVVYPADNAGTTLTSTDTIVIKRKPRQVQEVDLESQQGYFAETQEEALDRLTNMIIDIEERLNRVIKVPATESDDLIIPGRNTRANKFFSFDSNGDPAVTTDAGADINSVTVSSFMETVVDDADGDTALATLGLSGNAIAAIKESSNADIRDSLVADTQWRTTNIVNADFVGGTTNSIDADEGKLITFDIGAADRTMTLPPSATLTSGYRIGAKLQSRTTTNKLIITTDGSDTIKGVRSPNDTIELKGLDDSIWFTWNGSLWVVIVNDVAPVTSFYTVDGTHTWTVGFNTAYVKIVGGGGGGGGCGGTASDENSVGGGGGAGAHHEGSLRIPVTSSVVSIGGGGAGGVGDAAGGTGGATTLSSVVSVTGGSGGAGGTESDTADDESAGGVGGNGFTETATYDWSIETIGQTGGSGTLVGGVAVPGGHGGGNPLGVGGGCPGGSGDGQDGLAFGTGGAGAKNGVSATASNGGDGRNGFVVIVEYLF